ncbi:hypothetical protein G6F56_004080 [Rhizopus delemar]|nr:hypothetical protein G6F56_004080 [Rhizopus delemar]
MEEDLFLAEGEKVATPMANSETTKSSIPTTSTTKQIHYKLLETSKKPTSNTNSGQDHDNYTLEGADKQLQRSEGWDNSKRTSFSIPRIMEANDTSSMANISPTTWLQASIYKNTHPVEILTDEYIYDGTDSDKRGSFQVPRSRDYRKITDTGQKFSVELF